MKLDRFFNFKTVIFVAAMFITACAALFSVSGISKLFAGATMSAGTMALALEIGKVVSVSFLYRFWKEIGRSLKIYLMLASVVLMVLTSAGIYGYLTAAYAKVAQGPLELTSQIRTMDTQIATVQSELDRYSARQSQLMSLRTQQEARVDELIRKSETGTSSAVRTAQNQIIQYDRELRSLTESLNRRSAYRDSLSASQAAKTLEINANQEIGTFVYIAKMLNTDLDTVVKWFTLAIVLVFDPLAVALIIAYNFLVRRDGESVVGPVSVIPHSSPEQAAESTETANLVHEVRGISS